MKTQQVLPWKKTTITNVNPKIKLVNFFIIRFREREREKKTKENNTKSLKSKLIRNKKKREMREKLWICSNLIFFLFSVKKNKESERTISKTSADQSRI